MTHPCGIICLFICAVQMNIAEFVILPAQIIILAKFLLATRHDVFAIY